MGKDFKEGRAARKERLQGAKDLKGRKEIFKGGKDLMEGRKGGRI